MPHSISSRSQGRPVAGGAIAAVWAVLAFFGVALSGLATVLAGWLPGALVFLAGLYPAGRLAGLRRRTTLAVAGALSLLGGLALYASGPPGVSQLRFAAWQVGVPAGWVQVESESWGNHFCFDDCPTHLRTDRVPMPVGQAVDDWAAFLAAQGIEGRPPELGDSGGDEERWGTWHRGRLRLEAVFIGPADADGEWEVEPGTSIVRVFWSGR